MKLVTLVRELLPLIGGQAFEDRLVDLNTGIRRRNRDTSLRLRATTFAALPWIAILAWAVTAFYRSTLRKDELLAEREGQRQAAQGIPPGNDA